MIIHLFEKELYKVNVLESVKYPETIVTVKAHDADAVLSDDDKINGYSDVRYTLRGDNSDLFRINNITGAVQVAENKTLDRERQSVLRFEVEASDIPGGGASRLKTTATILIDVLDVDDNTPQFEKDVYTAVVPENVPTGISVINVTATDPDEGLGGEIRYELLDEAEANGLFTIDGVTGEITSKKALTGRGRTDPYRLLVGAMDGGGHSGVASLSLYIGDVSANDGVPRFIRPAVGEIITVTENATIGTPVYQVVASDPDDPTQPSGQLFYSIQPSNADDKIFAIDSKSGVITTRQSLDRERKDSYTLVLAATDRGQPPQQTTRIISITLLDVDDHKPHFARNLDDPPLLMTVEEEVPIGTVIGQFEAIDEDIGENAVIDYVITAGNDNALLNLQRTNTSKAVVVAAARLDREMVAKILITVKCFKYGTTPRLDKSYNRLDPSEIQVLVKILDIDDHLPEFGSTNMTVGIRLNVPVDTLIATVKAVDKDPEASPINYNIVNMTFESPIKGKSLSNVTDVILLDNVTGDLKIMKNLIHYADGTFRLIVRANNTNDSERFSDMLLEVAVVRERDLLRLVLAGALREELGAELGAALGGRGLRLQLHDHHAALFTHPGPCFQFRKIDSGEALTPKAMKSTIRALGVEFQSILEKFNVQNITSCGVSRTKHSLAQHALLALAGVLPFAAFIATLVLCCMHSSAKKRAREALLIVREPAVAASSMSLPTRLYAEPLYST